MLKCLKSGYSSFKDIHIPNCIAKEAWWRIGMSSALKSGDSSSDPCKGDNYSD